MSAQTSAPFRNQSKQDQSVQNPFTDDSRSITDFTSPRSNSLIDNSVGKLDQLLNSLNHLHSRSTDILLQQSHEMTQDSLKRLEVESTSSESLSAAAIAQYPYYNLDDVMASPSSYSQSPGGNLHSGSGSKKYTPKSSPKKQPQLQQFQQHSSSGSGSRGRQEQAGHDGVPLSPIDDDAFNQVPKRFSQFIIDQQNPHISQRLDNLSMISSSLKSDHMGNRGQDEDESGDSRETMLSQNQNNITSSTMESHRSNNNISADHNVIQSVSLSTRDDMSESMGSQATIFSTRQEPEALLINRRVGRINTGLNKTKSLFNKNKNKSKNSRLKVINRTSTVRLYKSPTSSITSSLLMNNQNKVRGGRVGRIGGSGSGTGTSSSILSSTSLARHNAIKTKKGSWWYRLQLKIRQFWTKFKFYNFKASSSKKRQVSIQKHSGGGSRGVSQSVNVTKSKSLVRKFRENPQNQDLKRLASIKLPPAYKLDHPQMRTTSGVTGDAGRLQISTPVNNPQLGKIQKVERVAMNDELKRYAGAGLLPLSFQQQHDPRLPPLQKQRQHSNQLLTPEEIADESTGKYTHLSNYINQQESRYLYQSRMKQRQGQLQGARGVGDMQFLRSEDTEEFPSPQIGTSEIDHPSWATGATTSSVTTSQAPPPAPPPHLDTSYMTQHLRENHHQEEENGDDKVYDKAKITKLWQTYLLRVLYNRIALRQEINQFEQYLVTKETSDVINMIFERARRDAELGEDDKSATTIRIDDQRPSKNTSIVSPKPSMKNKDMVNSALPVDANVGADGDAASSSSVYSQDDVISTTTFSTTTSTHITANPNEHGDVLFDPQDQEFTNTVLNRRSMLAEMLEYHSSEEEQDDEDGDEIEGEDTISYSGSVSQLSKSVIGSVMTQGSLRSLHSGAGSGGLDELRRYGTVIKRPSRRNSTRRSANRSGTTDDEQVSMHSRALGIKRSFGMNHSLSELTSAEA